MSETTGFICPSSGDYCAAADAMIQDPNNWVNDAIVAQMCRIGRSPKELSTSTCVFAGMTDYKPASAAQGEKDASS